MPFFKTEKGKKINVWFIVLDHLDAWMQGSGASTCHNRFVMLAGINLFFLRQSVLFVSLMAINGHTMLSSGHREIE